ncbi:unnamed protein product [Ixodes pacificus]
MDYCKSVCTDRKIQPVSPESCRFCYFVKKPSKQNQQPHDQRGRIVVFAVTNKRAYVSPRLWSHNGRSANETALYGGPGLVCCLRLVYSEQRNELNVIEINVMPS